MSYTKWTDDVLSELKKSVCLVDEAQVEAFVSELRKANRIFCDGKGRSGLQAQSFAIRLAQMGLTAYEVSANATPAIETGDLLVICSGSGETATLVQHAKTARRSGARIALITNCLESRIGEVCDISVQVYAQSKGDGMTKSIQPMGTLFEQTVGILLDVVVLMLMEEMAITNEDMYRKHSNLE